jgi:hypothetical protein
MVELDDVVQVAATSRSRAPREHAGAVAEEDLFADPVGDLVARCGQIGVEVDHRLDGDLGARVTAPAADLVQEHESLAFLQTAGGTEHGVLANGLRREVGVEDDLAGGGEVGSRYAGSFLTGYSTTGSTGGAEEVEGGLGAGEVTEGLGPSHVQ